MQILITLTVTVDEDYILAQAERRGRAVGAVLAELGALLEGRASDAARWPDGVLRVGSLVMCMPKTEQASA